MPCTFQPHQKQAAVSIQLLSSKATIRVYTHIVARLDHVFSSDKRNQSLVDLGLRHFRVLDDFGDSQPFASSSEKSHADVFGDGVLFRVVSSAAVLEWKCLDDLIGIRFALLFLC